MKRAIIPVVALSCCLWAAAALSATITGLVVEDGKGSIRVRDDAGKELRLYMDRGMKYVPEDYRALEGDRVTVTYEIEKHRSKGDIEAIREIKREAVAKQNEMPPNPLHGTVREVGRKMIRIYAPALDREITFDMMRELGKPPQVGDKGMATFERVPSRFGNGYVYQLTGFTKD